MAVGERRNYQYQDPSILPFVAALTSMIPPQQSASKSYSSHGTNVDEQTVPQGYRPVKPESYKNNLQNNYLMNDRLTYGTWNNSTYPLNHNVAAYPLATIQPGMNDAVPIQGTDTTLTRQASIPYGSLDQYLDNSGFDYDQFDNLDFPGIYDYPGNFSLEDYADLEKVAEAETDISFDAAVKHEKPKNEGKNLQEMESMMNTNILNEKSDNDWVPTAFTDSPDNVVVAPVVGNDQSLAELDKFNLIGILDDFYPTPNSGEWSTGFESRASENQPSTVSEQIVVKTEPGESGQNICDFALQQIVKDASSSLPVDHEELIQMPVSRFNELLVSLNQEQSNLAKDIRRRGKNKEAARLCRKRKLDNISTLEGNVTSLNAEKSRMLEERKQIVSETKELERNIERVYKILMKGLNDKNLSSSSDFSILHYSEGNTFLLKK